LSKVAKIFVNILKGDFWGVWRRQDCCQTPHFFM
jgi:hypothetical protein